MTDVDKQGTDLTSVVGEPLRGDEHLTEFVFFLMREHVPVVVIENAMMSAFSRRGHMESFPELKAYAESVASHLLGRTGVQE